MQLNLLFSKEGYTLNNFQAEVCNRQLRLKVQLLMYTDTTNYLNSYDMTVLDATHQQQKTIKYRKVA